MSRRELKSLGIWSSRDMKTNTLNKRRVAAEAATAQIAVVAADESEDHSEDQEDTQDHGADVIVSAKEQETRLVTVAVFEHTMINDKEPGRTTLFAHKIDWPVIVQSNTRCLDTNTFEAHFGINNVVQVQYCIINDKQPKGHHNDPKSWRIANEKQVPLAVDDSVLLQVYVRDRNKITIVHPAALQTSGVKRKDRSDDTEQEKTKETKEQAKEKRLISYLVFDQEKHELFRNERYWEVVNVNSKSTLNMDVNILSSLFGVDNILKIEYNTLSQNQQGLAAKGMREFKDNIVYMASGGQFGTILHVTIRNIDVWRQASAKHTRLCTKRYRIGRVWVVKELSVSEAKPETKPEVKQQRMALPETESRRTTFSDHLGEIVSTNGTQTKEKEKQKEVGWEDTNKRLKVVRDEEALLVGPNAAGLLAEPDAAGLLTEPDAAGLLPEPDAAGLLPEPDAAGLQENDFNGLKDAFVRNGEEKARLQREYAEAKKRADEVEKRLKTALEKKLESQKTETQRLVVALQKEKERHKAMESILATVS